MKEIRDNIIWGKNAGLENEITQRIWSNKVLILNKEQALIKELAKE